jgi:hypothetical protein
MLEVFAALGLLTMLPKPKPVVTAPKVQIVVPKPAPKVIQDVYYANCSAARAAGAAPLYAGEPGYRSRLDRDGDGVACE